jgi:outer membrane protein OmpA-like peptidoglycan-associated protein
MRAQRRAADSKTAKSLERIWQTYADEVGLPASEAASDVPPPRPDEAPTPGRRPFPVMLGNVGRPLVATAIAVVGIAGVALWHGSSDAPDTADRQPPTRASAPAGKPERAAPPAVSVSPAPASKEPAAQPAARTTTKPSAETGRAGTDVMDRINFELGSDRINDAAKPILDRIAHEMTANRDWRMAIEGHADAQGAPDDNRALSERRALAVKSYLQSAGVAPGRLSTSGFGASHPVAPHDARGHVLNRRVELHRR